MGTEVTIDIREDLPDFEAYVRARVEAHLAASNAHENSKPVKMIDLGFEYGQANWVVLVFDTRPDAEPDGEWTRELDNESSILRRPNWPIWHELPDDANVFIIDLAGRKCDAELGDNDIMAAVIGKTLKRVLVNARDQGVFNPLRRAENCELSVEHFDGGYGWPAYEDRGKENLL